MPVVIASWIVTVLPGMRGAARTGLISIPGARVASHDDPLVLTTECPEPEFPAMHGALQAVPGVRSVSMVVAYREQDGA
jgi:nitrate reductase NapAB chaperone NapD